MTRKMMNQVAEWVAGYEAIVAEKLATGEDADFEVGQYDRLRVVMAYLEERAAR